MPGNANAAVQYDHRRERSAAVGRTIAVELCRQTGMRSRQIATEVCRRVSRKVRKLDEGTGRDGAGTEQ